MTIMCDITEIISLLNAMFAETLAGSWHLIDINVMMTCRWHHNGVSIVWSTFIQAKIKENIKAPHHWSLWGEFTYDQWISPHEGPGTRKMFPFDDIVIKCLVEIWSRLIWYWPVDFNTIIGCLDVLVLISDHQTTMLTWLWPEPWESYCVLSVMYLVCVNQCRKWRVRYCNLSFLCTRSCGSWHTNLGYSSLMVTRPSW